MSKLARQAERLKLARLLEKDAGKLAYADKLDAATLAALRLQITSTLFDSNRGTYQRLVAASRLLPASLVAVISEKAMGPWLCARAAGYMPAERAIDVAKRLPTRFLADTCLQLDPRRVHDIIHGMPLDRVKEVARELIQRQDYITLGRFVDCMPDTVIRAVLDDIKDNAVLLRIAFFVEEKSSLDRITLMLPDSRIRDVILTAAAPGSALWPEALALMAYVKPELRGKLADKAAREDDAVLVSMITAIEAQGLWTEALPIVASMSAESQQKLVNLVAAQPATMLQHVLDAAQEQKRWPELLPLIPLMDEDARQRISHMAEHLGDASIQDIISASHEHGLWGATLDLVAHIPAGRRNAIALLLVNTGQAVLEKLLEAVTTGERWPVLIDMLQQMPLAERQTLLETAIKVGPATMTRLVEAADATVVTQLIEAVNQAGLWPSLVDSLAQMPVTDQQTLIEASIQMGPATLAYLIEAAENGGLWELALKALAASHADIRAQVPGIVAQLPEAQQQRLRTQAESLGLAALLA